MIFRIFATLILVTIVVGSLWFGGAEREPVPKTTVESPDTDLGYAARKATLIETGPDGLPMYTVKADVIHQRANDKVDFERVQMSFRDQAGQLWTARAQHGELGQASGIVDLSGNVHVDGLLPGSDQNADLSTESLSVDSRADLISTEEPVTLDWAGRELNSRGMVAALKERRLLLESNVHGTFVP